MPAELVAVIAVVLAVVGTAGIVVPVLPGSLTVAAALLVWAIWGGSPWGWIAFGVGLTLLAVGGSASWFLTGRTLARREIPQWPIIVGVVAGVVGLFLLPGLGFVIGFVLGVVASEFARVRDVRQAVATSWHMVKAVGLGMLVELGCAVLALSVLAASVITRFTLA